MPHKLIARHNGDKLWEPDFNYPRAVFRNFSQLLLFCVGLIVHVYRKIQEISQQLTFMYRHFRLESGQAKQSVLLYKFVLNVTKHVASRHRKLQFYPDWHDGSASEM